MHEAAIANINTRMADLAAATGGHRGRGRVAAPGPAGGEPAVVAGPATAGGRDRACEDTRRRSSQARAADERQRGGRVSQR